MPVSSRHLLLWAMLGLALWTAGAFLLPLVFGVILAIALWPLNQRWAGPGVGVRRRVFVPLAITLATGLAFILPLTVALIEVAAQGQALLDWLSRAQTIGVPTPDWLPGLPLIGRRAAEWWQLHVQQPDALMNGMTESALGTAAEWALATGSGILSRSLLLLVGLMALFFILRDGERLGAQAKSLAVHQLGPFGERFVDELVVAVRGTVIGTIVVAIAEGALIGAAYAVAGVPHPVFLGFLTAAFAMLPFGAWAVFSVVSIYLAINGQPLAAGLLFVYGAAVMVIGDNFVTPYLVGAKLHLPLLFAFVGVFGGLASFGLVGIFIGPVIMAGLLIVIRELWPADEEAAA
ncbi:AI-2E family transporter [Altererythrobacter sp. Root672]|uniref:AI-2E family transporter n=1 Tax=Altererythrobacter sp. Root672 TaxID=1736584 RepID=UPI000A586FC0|nr:AI-2E family transporter [Altererythrobacter sp. Root672]